MQQVGPFYDKEIKCEICEITYKTKRLRSRFIRTEKVHSDFFTEFKDKQCNPYFYEVHVCPTCGFASSENFSNHFKPGSKDRIAQQVGASWKPRDFGGIRTIEEAIETYKLGIVSGTLKSEKHIVLAGLCMRLAWLFRMTEDKAQELRFLRLSLKHYENAYQNSDHVGTQMSDMRLLYLIGELQRRTGNREEAVRYFSRVIGHKNRAFETKLVEMARDQWYEIREQDKEADQATEEE